MLSWLAKRMIARNIAIALAAAVLALSALAAVQSSGSSGTPPAARAATPSHGGRALRSAPRPPITKWLIPFPPKRKRQMAAYSERHYGEPTWRLTHPHVIVEHIAVASSAAAVYSTFAPDVPDVELHELPQVCSNFVVSGSGRIYELVHLAIRCRHTVGLNWTAIGIEHTGFRDADVLGNRRQLRASLRLTQYLRCRFHIRLRDVIGHSESLTSPYHRERVASLRRQTHSDWSRQSMQIYRRKLRTLGACR